VLLLLLGQTLFRDAFGPLAAFLYWGMCFVLTLLAMVVALLDMMIVRRRARRQHRELLESTFGSIAARQGQARKGPDGPEQG
jgi:hypothetical protein